MQPFLLCVYLVIISFPLILAADWSIAVGYWTVFHCFSLLVNFRMGISVLSSLLKSRLNVLSSFAMVTMVDLKFTGHSLVVFYITRHTKRIKNKIKKLKLKKKKKLNIIFFLKILKKKKKKKTIKKKNNKNILKK